MTTKFNIGDTVIYHHKNVKFKIDSVHITDKGIFYGGEHGISGIKEDELIKAPVTREEALPAALKDIGRRVSKRIDVALSESEGCFEVRSNMHHGAYIPMSKDDYYYEEK